MEFLPKPWRSITDALKKAKKRVAVTPYLNGDVFAMLPLRKSADVLVVDACDRNVRGGLTNPFEIEKFAEAGVRCYTVADLHAKVYRADRNLFVGSANGSTNSRDTLLEACLEVRSSIVIEQFERWLGELPRVPLLPHSSELEYLKAIYKPPKWSKRLSAAPRTSAAWIASVTYYDRSDETDDYAEGIGRDHGIKSANIFRLTLGRRQRIARDARPGDEFFIIDHRDGEVIAYAPMRLIAPPKLINNRYRLALEDRGGKPVDKGTFVKAARKVCASFPRTAMSTRAIDGDTAAELRKLWR